MYKFNNLSGQKFGRLFVNSFVSYKNGGSMYNCTCDCGTEKVVRGSSLTSGKTVSCGCYRRELSSKRMIRTFDESRKYRIIIHAIGDQLPAYLL